jgi:hypothetical protein
VSQPFFDLSAIIEIWSVIYQATKQAHAYRAKARGRAGLAHDGARGALGQGAEAGRGVRCEHVAWERSYGRGGSGWSGWAGGCGGSRGVWGSINWLLASVGPVDGWFR